MRSDECLSVLWHWLVDRIGGYASNDSKTGYTMVCSCPSKVRRNSRRTFTGKKPQTAGVECDSLEHLTWIQVHKCTERMFWDLKTQVLFFMKLILWQECLSLRAKRTTNVNREFAWRVDLSAERLGKAWLKNECLVYVWALPERGKPQFVQIKWQLLKYCSKCIQVPSRVR